MRPSAVIGLRILPAAAALIAMPVTAMPLSAAAAGQSWQQICAGDGAHWMLLPDPTRRGGDAPADDRAHAGCAHALCSRERRVSGRANRVA